MLTRIANQNRRRWLKRQHVWARKQLSFLKSTRLIGDALQAAFESDMRGMRVLSRVGVTFTEDQTASIRQLHEAGQDAAAQGIILTSDIQYWADWLERVRVEHE